MIAFVNLDIDLDLDIYNIYKLEIKTHLLKVQIFIIFSDAFSIKDEKLFVPFKKCVLISSLFVENTLQVSFIYIYISIYRGSDLQKPII